VYSPLYQSYRDGVGYTFVTDSPSPTGAQRAATFMKIPVFTHRWQTFHSKRQPSEPAPTRLLLQVALTRPECGVEWGMSLIDDTEEGVRQHGGVPVSAVTPGGPADLAGVAAGDVISHVTGRKVCSLHGFKCMMVSAMLAGTLELDLSLHRPPCLLLAADQRRTSSAAQCKEPEAEELELALQELEELALQELEEQELQELELALSTMEAEAGKAGGEAEETEEAEGEEAGRPLQGLKQAQRIGVRVTAEAAALAGALAASAEDMAQLERRRQADASAAEQELKQALAESAQIARAEAFGSLGPLATPPARRTRARDLAGAPIFCGPPSPSPAAGAVPPTSALEEEAQLQLALARSEAQAAAPPPPPPPPPPPQQLQQQQQQQQPTATPTATPAARPASMPAAAPSAAGAVTAVIATSAVKEAFAAHRMRRRALQPQP